MKESDGVHVTTWVALPPADAFAVFTEEVDAWWRRGRRFRFGDGAASTMRFEPGEGGRLLETVDATGLTREHGRIRRWAPGEQVVWVIDDPRYGVPIEVDIRFDAEAGGTRVAVTQRGLADVAPDAVARHGLQGEAFLSMMGLWWADLLFGLRRSCAGRAHDGRI